MTDPTEQIMDDEPEVPRRARWWVRGSLLLIAAVMGLVFFIATQVQPYNPDGSAMRMASHQTLGMPACNFNRLAGMPCPSCGMTTSFALLVRGDISNSLRANWVGTGLAVFCALMIPWCIVSSLRGRLLWVRRVDVVMGFLIGTFTILMLGRWGVLMLLTVK